MATDPLQATRKYVDEAFAGLDLSGVTAKVAHQRCFAALETLSAQLDLITQFERPRQERVRADRAKAAAKQAAEAAKSAAEKQARIERRKALRP